MQKVRWPVVISIFLVSGVALAQTPAAAPTPAAGQSGRNPSSANGSGMQISTGTVTQYTAGQKIAIKLDGGEQLALDLQKDVRVDGSVAVGQLAAIMWMTDGTGARHVTSITAAPGPGESGKSTLETNYAGMSATPRATPTPSASAPTPRPTPGPHSR